MTQANDDTEIKHILTRTKVIALVGYSEKPARASHQVAAFLADKGYRVIPVNPGQAGKEALGETIVASLADIPASAGVDMVDIFRRSDAVEPVVEAALEHLPDLKTVWMQLGVENAAARAMARAQGVDVVMNRCPKIEYPRLIG